MPYNNKGYFSLKHCVYSPKALALGINNFPGSDYHALYAKNLEEYYKKEIAYGKDY